MHSSVFTAAALLALYVGCVAGFGAEGHRIVATIAQNRLSTKSLAYLGELLKGTNYTTLVDLAPLPDDFVHSPAGRWSSKSHFVNVPRNATAYDDTFCGDFCTVSAIRNYTALMRQELSSPHVCRFGSGDEPCPIEFLTHYIGDVHQPLHVGYADDAGGNAIHVNFFGQVNTTYGPISLHTIWDSSMIYKWQPKLAGAVKNLTLYMSDHGDIVKSFSESSNPAVWATESLQITAHDVYTEDVSVPITEAYYNNKIGVLMKRLVAGGVRLADTINRITDSSLDPTRRMTYTENASASVGTNLVLIVAVVMAVLMM